MKNEVKQVLFIVNKNAGTGYQPSVEGQIMKACRKNNIPYTISFTEGPRHATTLAKQAAGSQQFDTVVAVGGDGTVNEVAQGLVHTSTTMGIVPNGSGNGLARHLRIPLTISHALEKLFTSQPIKMDTFLLNDRLSLNVSGIGFDGRISNLFAKEKKRGFQGYVKHALRESVSFKEFDAEINLGHEVINTKSFIIAIANSSQYGNNARIAPSASVCDNILHVNLLKKIPFYRVDFFYAFFAGDISRTPFCKIVEARQFTIRVKEPMSFHIDGEGAGEADIFDVRIQPASLLMRIPRETLRP